MLSLTFIYLVRLSDALGKAPTPMLLGSMMMSSGTLGGGSEDVVEAP
jgi:hypothetical protein